ncbi:FecR family protein [Gimibacter soli]|uniref:FecR domain-containing protein n=1 Tax=Gimibacter soli TaxID=3024400 RepID=A0AAF0BL96_9PROT|nr:FecR domain-containing protein [Gimibacter soli]WCL53205.1 FecR domain-containing protein [Gimibacter soli]
MNENNNPMPAELIDETAHGWVARQRSGIMDESDVAELNDWLAAAEQHRDAYWRARAFDESLDDIAAEVLEPLLIAELEADAAAAAEARMPAGPATGDILPFRKAAPPAPTNSGWRTMMQAAAVFLVAGVAGLMLWQEPPAEATIYETAVGRQQTISLADGSAVTLNTGSRLEAGLDGNDRHVRLQQGEAFFDVSHDEAHPFVVESGNTRIIVLGTSFSVRHDSEGETVVVLTGRVQVQYENDQRTESALLSANERIKVSETDEPKVEKSEPGIDFAWRDGWLRFRQTPLAEAVADLNRYRRQKLVIEDERLKNLPLTADFRFEQEADTVKALEAAFNLKARRSTTGEMILEAAQS